METKIPPLLVGIIMGLLMWLIADQLHWGNYVLEQKALTFLVLGIVGGSMALTGVITFNRANTTSNPVSPDTASTLVTHGIYSRTRNPMYLGVFFVLLGLSIHLGSLLSLAVLPVYVWYITQFQILPEEQALERIFGVSFAEYQNKVRRWI